MFRHDPVVTLRLHAVRLQHVDVVQPQTIKASVDRGLHRFRANQLTFCGGAVLRRHDEIVARHARQPVPKKDLAVAVAGGGVEEIDPVVQ